MRRFFSKQNRALLAELVRTDFKLRYQGSVLGYAWSLLRPLFIFAILYTVFVVVFPLGKGIPHYPIYLFTGMVIWNFFNEMTSQSLGSIVGRGDLIRKIRIPRWMIVFSSSISALINLGFNLIVLAVFMVLSHVDPMRSIVLLPFILLEAYLFALGVSLFLSALFVKLRDLNYIWEVVMQAGFYATPILYPISRITGHHGLAIQKLMFLNPLTQIIQDARYALIIHDTEKSPTIYSLFHGGYDKFAPFIIVVLMLIGGLLYFKREAKYFAENI
jgi:ABC-2 type transport system permease protein